MRTYMSGGGSVVIFFLFLFSREQVAMGGLKLGLRAGYRFAIVWLGMNDDVLLSRLREGTTSFSASFSSPEKFSA